MGLFDPHPGAWNIFGVQLPDFGLTESAAKAVSGGNTQDLSNALTVGANPNYSNPLSSGSNLPYTSPLPKQSGVLGAETYVPPASTSPTPTYSQTVAPINTDIQNKTTNLANQISGGWDQYIASLNDQLNGTGAGSLQSLATPQYAQSNALYQGGLSDLGASKDIAYNSLEGAKTQAQTNQAKTLRDLSGNIANAFQAGNNFLGSTGVGNPSAANMYSYALAKEASKQRGNVMGQTNDAINQINLKEADLNTNYMNGLKQLDSQKQQQYGQIATWLAQAQQQIQGEIGQAGLGKSKDLESLSQNLLNQAIAAKNQVDQQFATSASYLQQWAANNAQTISQLKQGLSAAGQYNPAAQTYTPINGNPTVNSPTGTTSVNPLIGYGGTGGTTTNDQTNNPLLFQTPTFQ